MHKKVYYNSACPICKAGIESQRQHLEQCGIDDIEWIDVHGNPTAVSEVDSSLEQIRERLHFQDSDGVLSTGIDAFIHLWQQSPSQRWLAKILQFPVIKLLAQVSYNCFAKLLYRWNRLLKHW